MRPGAALAVTDYFNYRAFTFAPRSDVLDRVEAGDMSVAEALEVLAQ